MGNIPCSSTRWRLEDGSKMDSENSCLLSSHTASADSRNFLRLRITRAYWVIDLLLVNFSPLIQILQVVFLEKPRILEISQHSPIMRRWASKGSRITSRQDQGPMWVCTAPAVRTLLILPLSTPGSAHKSV